MRWGVGFNGLGIYIVLGAWEVGEEEVLMGVVRIITSHSFGFVIGLVERGRYDCFFCNEGVGVCL